PARAQGPARDPVPAETSCDPFDRRTAQARRIGGADECARARSRHDARTQAALLQNLEHPDMRRAERAPAAQRDAELRVVTIRIRLHMVTVPPRDRGGVRGEMRVRYG